MSDVHHEAASRARSAWRSLRDTTLYTVFGARMSSWSTGTALGVLRATWSDCRGHLRILDGSRAFGAGVGGEEGSTALSPRPTLESDGGNVLLAFPAYKGALYFP